MAIGYSNRQAAGPAWRPPLAICFLSVWELIFLSIPSHDPVSSRLTDKHPTVTPTCRFPDFFHGPPHSYSMSPLCGRGPRHCMELELLLYAPCLSSQLFGLPIPAHLFCSFTEFSRVEFIFLPNQVTFAFLPFLSQWHLFELIFAATAY